LLAGRVIGGDGIPRDLLRLILVLEALVQLFYHSAALVSTGDCSSTSTTLVGSTAHVEACPVSQVHLVGLGPRSEEATRDVVLLAIVGSRRLVLLRVGPLVGVDLRGLQEEELLGL
jgi:hypothetical protein